MRYQISASLLFIAMAHSATAMAIENDQGMKSAAMEMAQAMPIRTYKAQGVVNKIDLQHSEINLTHGPIKSLGWSGMTMDFAVKDATILKHSKVGQKVDFELVNEGPGKYVISWIAPAK